MAPKKANSTAEATLPALLHHVGGELRVTKAAIEAEHESQIEVIDEGASYLLRLHRGAKP